MLRRAVIDIGTNSVKLLVADVAADVEPVLETSRQTRLGQGFYETHRLQPGPILDTARTVGEFAQRARAPGTESIRIIATSGISDYAVKACSLGAKRFIQKPSTTEVLLKEMRLVLEARA